jgi:hypothetical protein
MKVGTEILWRWKHNKHCYSNGIVRNVHGMFITVEDSIYSCDHGNWLDMNELDIQIVKESVDDNKGI